MFKSLAATLAMALSCGGTTAPPRGHVCDGSGSIRLGMAVTDDPGRVLLGMQVMFDNGDGFLYVDGTCRYWSARSTDPWAGIHHGSLTPAEAAQLEAATHYAEWQDAAYRASKVADVSIDYFFDTQVQLSCTSVCGGSAPAFLQQLTSNFDGIVAPIWTAGSEAGSDGPIRLVATRFDAGSYSFVTHFAWPLSKTLASIALLPSAAPQYGQGLSFAGDDAAKLREIRATYRAGNYQQQGVTGIPFDEGDQVYLVYFRDALPFEDARERGAQRRDPGPLVHPRRRLPRLGEDAIHLGRELLGPRGRHHPAQDAPAVLAKELTLVHAPAEYPGSGCRSYRRFCHSTYPSAAPGDDYPERSGPMAEQRYARSKSLP